MTDTSVQLTSPGKEAFETVASFCYRSVSRIVSQGESVMPVLLAGAIEGGDFRVHIAGPVPLGQDGAYANPLPILDMLLRQPGIEIAVHISEAWYLRDQRPEPCRAVSGITRAVKRP